MKCVITIKDYHFSGGQTEKAELTTTADIYGESDNYFIDYDEQSDELKGCRTKINVKDGGIVTVSREGRYNTELVMEKGKRNLCCYNTPVGQLMMGVYSSKIDSQYVENKHTLLDFSYTLDFNNELLSKNRIKIIAEYKEED